MAGNGSEVDTVLVDEQVVVRHGRPTYLTTEEEQALYADASARAATISQRAGIVAHCPWRLVGRWLLPTRPSEDDGNRRLEYRRDLRDLAECARLQALPLREDYAQQLKWDDLCDREGLRRTSGGQPRAATGEVPPQQSHGISAHCS
jgi:hypothetical protein